MQAGSISQAALRLACSKSVLSRQLARLEADLGARLLQRSTRRLTLTEIGEGVLSQLRLMPLLVEFTQQHPKVEVVLTVADRMVDLIAEHIDVAIRIAHLEDSSAGGAQAHRHLTRAGGRPRLPGAARCAHRAR